MSKLKRNDPCPCGSKKKYKFCCWAKDTQNQKDDSSRKNTNERMYSDDGDGATGLDA